MADSPTIFEINPNSGVPIYRQIVDQVLALVAGGLLREGDLLPSVRQVAQDAAVNPMTVSKAYSRLETEGVVRRVAARAWKFSPPRKTARSTNASSSFARRSSRPCIAPGNSASIRSKSAKSFPPCYRTNKHERRRSPRRPPAQKLSATKKCCAASTSRSSPAPCSACSAPTAAARRRSSNARLGCCGRPAAR